MHTYFTYLRTSNEYSFVLKRCGKSKSQSGTSHFNVDTDTFRLLFSFFFLSTRLRIHTDLFCIFIICNTKANKNIIVGQRQPLNTLHHNIQQNSYCAYLWGSGTKTRRNLM